MAEHFAENAIGDTCIAWCRKCGRLTSHRLDRVAVTSHASKAGPCLEHGPIVNHRGENKKQQRDREQRERQNRQRELFR